MDRFSDFNTDKEIDETRKLMARVNSAAEDMEGEISVWADCEVAYLGQQPKKDGIPNTRVNIILANIEGQAAEMATQNVAVSCIGQSSNDHEFAEEARINLEWDLRHQEDLQGTILDAARRFLGKGGFWYKVWYDQRAFNKFGIPRIETPSIDRVVVDQKCTHYRRLQEAEWIAEFIESSRTMAELTYGTEKSDSIKYGVIDDTNFAFKVDLDDQDTDSSWMLVQVWSKDEGKLRLREYAHCGLLLYDSFKGDDRKENQKKNKKVANSYYTENYDRYPYIFRPLYPKEGKLYGMGDAELILELQNMLNNLYDCLRMSSRPNLMLVDTRTDLDPKTLGDDSFEPIPYDGTDLAAQMGGAAVPVQAVAWNQSNPQWWNLIAAVHAEIQRVLRYSSLMMGQQGQANSATESAIQQQQGSKATNTKQKIMENALAEAVTYCLGLDLQFRKGKKALRLNDEENEYKTVDFGAMQRVPVMVETEAATRKMFEENGNEPPEMQILTERGKDVTKSVALDVKVNLGAGMPKNPAYIAELAKTFAQIVIPDKNGTPRPAVTWEEMRNMLETVMGFPIDREMQNKPQATPMQAMSQQMGAEAQMGGIPTQDPMSQLSAGGRPPMAPLNAIREQR